jgi:chromosome segregation ATPase
MSSANLAIKSFKTHLSCLKDQLAALVILDSTANQWPGVSSCCDGLQRAVVTIGSELLDVESAGQRSEVSRQTALKQITVLQDKLDQQLVICEKQASSLRSCQGELSACKAQLSITRARNKSDASEIESLKSSAKHQGDSLAGCQAELCDTQQQLQSAVTDRIRARDVSSMQSRQLVSAIQPIFRVVVAAAVLARCARLQ